MEEKEIHESPAAGSDTGVKGGEDTSHHRRIKSFVRRQTRQTGAQERAFRELGPRFIVDPAALDSGRITLDSLSLFGNSNPLVLEIGFGMGHATAQIALANPEINYLCAEVHTPGVGALLDRMDQGKIQNIRILHGDVVEFLEKHGKSGAFSGIHVFFPDPWQKKKHHKRRLIQAPFLEFLAPFCQAGSYIYMVTDWADYAAWMLEELAKSSSWRNEHPGFAPALSWRPQTSFERKGLAKEHVIREILVKKRV